MTDIPRSIRKRTNTPLCWSSSKSLHSTINLIVHTFLPILRTIDWKKAREKSVGKIKELVTEVV